MFCFCSYKKEKPNRTGKMMNLISCRAERGGSWEYRPAVAHGSQKKSEIIGNRYYLSSASKSWKLMVARLRRHLIQLVLPAKLLGKSIAHVASLIEEKKKRRRSFFKSIAKVVVCVATVLTWKRERSSIHYYTWNCRFISWLFTCCSIKTAI